ncbi:MAG: hypothetical protein K0V04_34540 [Deltaproteobacteria bacterium]|nr:hypothetical protein [Deltaproteobacteria bacterium]
MRTDRLFNVVVLQGALLVGGCDDGPPDEPVSNGLTSTGPVSASTGEPAEMGSSTGTADPGTTAGSGHGSTSGSDGGSTTGEPGQSEGPGGSTGPAVECSDPPDVEDPCGCPCCWINECVNTEPCCADFGSCAGS